MNWLDLASVAAKDAGEFLKDSRQKNIKILSEEGRDIKLALDQESEKRIIFCLEKGSHFPILSEEMGMEWASDRFKDYHWIVDPLDGSLNYWKEIPFCCVSIALWCGEKPILGVIYDFNRDELFTGIVGVDARVNGYPIHVSDVTVPEKAVLGTGFPVSTDFSDKGIQLFTSFVRTYKKVRLFGTAATSLAYVAAGRTDAYCERNIKIWDIAAGLAIVSSAGGGSIISPSDLPNCLSVFVSNQSLIEYFEENYLCAEGNLFSR